MTPRRARWLPALLGGMFPSLRPTRQPETAAVAHQARKMELVGQLAGGVVHDFNNHLQVVSANLELMRPRLATDAWLSERLAAAMAGIERATRLSRHLLAYAGPRPPTPEAVDAGALLSAMAEMLRPMLGAAVCVETALAHGLSPIAVDPQQLETALLNLALNARDAMPDGGRLTFAASPLTVAADDPAPGGLAPGGYLRIAVRDTGTGMAPEQLRRATEAFYTTKPAGKGTGLGLAMVHAFASQSGGGLELLSEPGRGTTALLSLPLSDPARQAQAARDPARGPPLLVLLAEDEPLIRMATADLIAEMGHRVRQAADGAEAIDVLREQPVDLLIADLGLPDMDGTALIERACALRPRLRVIVTTGRDAPGPDAWPHLRWLSKPYDGAALREAIEGATALPAGYATV